jgi:hypothetical protein
VVLTLGTAQHRTSLEVINGIPLEAGGYTLSREQDAEHGSQALQLAMERQFLKLMRSNNGISIRDARLLLMNGEMPRHG